MSQRDARIQVAIDLFKAWSSDDGVALTWEMSATQRNADFGPEVIGKVWRSPGMSCLVIRDGRVAHEVDYHDRVNVPLRSA